MVDSKERLVLTKGDTVLAWGTGHQIRASFGRDLLSIAEAQVPGDLCAPENYHVKGFVERALALSLVRDRPLLPRTRGPANQISAVAHDDGECHESDGKSAAKNGTKPEHQAALADRNWHYVALRGSLEH